MPSRTLVFTLGKGLRQQASNRYRSATYKFPNGTTSAPTAFFGLSLLHWMIHQKKARPDLVVVLGTRSSIWDALFEAYDDAVDESALHLADELSNLVITGSVANGHLEELERWLMTREGIPFRLRVVPEGLDHEGQMETLRTLAEVVPPGTELHMCVTHGLRHMPMLQMLSVFHLAQTASVALGGLYYGSLDLGSNGLECPVIELTHLAW